MILHTQKGVKNDYSVSYVGHHLRILRTYPFEDEE
jgi:hypothetical protein